MSHECPVANCLISVPRQMFMCARHWRMVPRPLQAAVYASYRSQGRFSENHAEAVRVVNEAEKGRASVLLPVGTKALTLWQPWASLIMIGAKPYEFRRWNFADKPHLAKLIGQRVVIHGGARSPRLSELDDIVERIHEGESALVADIALPFIAETRSALQAKRPPIAPLAAGLGTAILGEPKRSADLFKHIVADSDRLDQQMYAWPISDIQPFPAPIPASGAQGFWNWS